MTPQQIDKLILLDPDATIADAVKLDEGIIDFMIKEKLIKARALKITQTHEGV